MDVCISGVFTIVVSCYADLSGGCNDYENSVYYSNQYIAALIAV
jgi:hypothetical protein